MEEEGGEEENTSLIMKKTEREDEDIGKEKGRNTQA